MRVAIMTDIHANLPALRSALAAIGELGCDAIYHLGDAIGIGPFPAETLGLLLATPGMRFVSGNHDAWFAFGMPDPWPYGADQLEHQKWTHDQLDGKMRTAVAEWPFVREDTLDGVPASFLHYGLSDEDRWLATDSPASAQGFAHVVFPPEVGALDTIFARRQGRIVFYGHDHVESDLTGRARYVNAGPLGCFMDFKRYVGPVARFVVLETDGAEGYTLTRRAAPYDGVVVLRAMEERRVPARAEILKGFFGQE